MRPRAAVAVLCVLAAAGPSRATVKDPRSQEILRRDCRSQLGRRDITLFGNGTVRLRVWDPEGTLDMQLLELGPGEPEAYLNRLGQADLSEVDLPPAGPDEGWIDACELAMELPGQERVSFRYGQLDALPLALSPLVAIVDELAVRVSSNERGRGLGDSYVPRPGDVLLRKDGRLYEVVGPTSDGLGLELTGVEQPVTVYMLADAVRDEFVMLVERSGSRTER
ncbi:MAG: hypothetical protein R2991_04690 [Thermoanaerobaculia bacterium]